MLEAEQEKEEVWRPTKPTLRVRHRGDYAIVTVAGELDNYTAPSLRELLIDLVNQNNYRIIVNVDEVEVLDSTGLGVLNGCLRRVQSHDGSLNVVCTQERILKIFRITGLMKTFGVYETVDRVIAAKKGH